MDGDGLADGAVRVEGLEGSVDGREEDRGSPAVMPGPGLGPDPGPAPDLDSKYAVSFASAAHVEHGVPREEDETAKSQQQQQQQQRSATAYDHTPEHWRLKKEMIRNLYLEENLPLKSVMRIMSDEHNFSATERQYKRKFNEWNWKKYNSKGFKTSQLKGEQVSRSSGAKTCRRPADSAGRAALTQSQQRRQRFPTVQVDFTFANQLEQQIYGLYSGLQDLMNGTSQLHDPSRRLSELLSLPASGTHAVSLFLLSIRLFQAGDLYNGMVSVQRACQAVDNVLKEDGIMVFQSLILEIPFYLLAAERPREMQFFAQHLSLMLSMKKSAHPITHLAKMMHHISMANPDALLHHLRQMYELTKEQYQDVRDDNDLANLDARMDALSLGGKKDGPIVRRYESALDGFAVALRKARAQPQESPTEAIGNEFCRIATTNRLAPVPLDPMRAYEKFLERFLKGEDHSMFLLTQTDPWILEQYGETKNLMFAHHFRMGNIQSAIRCLEECTEAWECAGADTQPLNQYMKNYYVGRALQYRNQLESLLFQHGRAGGAAEAAAYGGEPRQIHELTGSPEEVIEPPL